MVNRVNRNPHDVTAFLLLLVVGRYFRATEAVYVIGGCDKPDKTRALLVLKLEDAQARY